MKKNQIIGVKTKKSLVELTFAPAVHDVLTMAPVRITLTRPEAELLASKLKAGIDEAKAWTPPTV